MAYPMVSPQPWWVLAVSGVASILFGLAALIWPGLTLFVLIVLFGVYAMVTGIVELVAMLRAIGAGTTWWTHLVLGLLGIVAGLVVFAYPGVTALLLLYVIAFWAITMGLVEIVAAFSSGEFLVMVAGVISIVFGFVLLSNPFLGALAYVMVIGVFAIVRGLLQLFQAIRVPVQPASR